MPNEVLVRYGTMPEVARFDAGEHAPLVRGERVLVKTHRGMQLGEVLDPVRSSRPDPTEGTPTNAKTDPLSRIVSRAQEADCAAWQALRAEAEQAFGEWRRRISDWNLALELIDLEWTFDRQKLILYVLTERGPDCTRLALQAAAAGLGIIEVQPVNADGLVTIPVSGGCGSCCSH